MYDNYKIMVYSPLLIIVRFLKSSIYSYPSLFGSMITYLFGREVDGGITRNHKKVLSIYG